MEEVGPAIVAADEIPELQELLDCKIQDTFCLTKRHFV